MKKLLFFGLLGLLLLSPPVKAQQQYLVVATCGTQVYPVAQRGLPLMDTTGNICTNATGGGGGSAITNPLGHATLDTAAVAVVPSATASFPVSAASLPLPTGAALDSSLATLHTDLGTLNTTASNSIPAGTNVIGALSANQSVNVAQFNGSTTPVGAGAASTAGVQRVAAAQDTTTIAGSAPGIAGTASTNVVTVQGIASGTNVPTAIASCSTCNANGAATIANSTPVGLPNDQFGVAADAKSTATDTTPATAMAVMKEISFMEQTPASRPVTNAGTFAVQVAATTSGGASVYHKIAAANDNHVVIKNGAGTVYGIDATAGGTSVQYVRLYDAGTGFNGCNSTTGLLWGQQVPAAAVAAGVGGGYAIPIPAVGIAFSTGLSICITGAVSDTDTTNAATTTLANVLYK